AVAVVSCRFAFARNYFFAPSADALLPAVASPPVVVSYHFAFARNYSSAPSADAAPPVVVSCHFVSVRNCFSAPSADVSFPVVVAFHSAGPQRNFCFHVAVVPYFFARADDVQTYYRYCAVQFCRYFEIVFCQIRSLCPRCSQCP